MTSEAFISNELENGLPGSLVDGRGMVIWVTGLAGSGKTSLCNALYRLLKPKMPELLLLDGDAVRSALGQDLSYAEEDRVKQVKRLQNLAKVLSEQNLVVIVAVVYAHPDLLEWNRRNLQPYFEVYLKASLDAVGNRDIKGLYTKVRAGQTTNVVGVDIPWHAPTSPDLVINTENPESPEILARQVAASIPRLAHALTAKYG